MPIKPGKACAHVGCRAVVKGRYCEQHRLQHQRQQSAQRRLDPERRERLAFYASPAWRALRAVVLADQPLCQHCHEAGRITPATLVDHIVEIKQGGERLDRANLQALCKPCHASKTATDGGRW